MITLALSTIEYTKWNNETIVHLFGRDRKLCRWHITAYNLKPYFYVNEIDPVFKNSQIIRIEKLPNWESISHKKIKRITMHLPEDVGGNWDGTKQGLRERFQTTYEDDIKFTERIAVDTKIKSGFKVPREIIDCNKDPIIPVDFKANLRRLHFDIETSGKETKGKFPNWRNPINRIYCISCIDTYTLEMTEFVFRSDFKEKSFHLKFKNPLDSKFGFKPEYNVTIHKFTTEKAMLESFIAYVADIDPDIPTGWNARKFDFPYVIERAKRLQVEVKHLSPLRSVYVDKAKGQATIKGRIVFDTWAAYKKLLTSSEESTKLGFVSTKLFGIGKVEHAGIDHDYLHNINRLIRYNLQDSFLDYAIAENQRIFDFFYDVKCYAGCSFEDVLDNSRIVDMYMLYKAKENKLALPSKREIAKEKKSRGAVVLQPPKPGIYCWVVVFDLNSLYPNCIISLNMGADTIVRNPPEDMKKDLIHSPIEGVYFRKDRIGFLAGIIRELLDYRNQMKDEKKRYEKEGNTAMADLYDRIQTVVKFITNSIFGVMGFNVFRLYDKDIFDNILTVARIVITFSIKFVINSGYTLRYRDTDSIFINMKENTLEKVKKEANMLIDKLNQAYDKLKAIFNIESHTFKMKVDKVFKKILMVRIRDKTKNKVAKKHYAGLMENDEIEITGFDRSDMSRVGNKIMKTVIEMALRDKQDQIVQYLQNELEKLRNNKYTLAEIAFAKGISMEFSEYKTKGNWVRAAMWTNLHSALWGSQTNYGMESKPKFISIDPTKLPKAYERIDLIALDDHDYLPPEIVKAINWDIVIEKTIYNKIDTILEAIGIDWDDVIGKTNVKKLNKF
jgi:DNA polymerase elongation subunit (family B)